MKTAIVLGMDINGLAVSRSLGRQGIEVYGIDEQDDIAFSSKYCKKKYVFPNPVVYPKECLNQFIEIGKSLGDKAVLLPTSDPYVAFVSKFRTELSHYFLFNIPESSILENILDKSKQYQLAMNLGIPVPKTILPKHIDDLKEGLISYPAVIKGSNSKQWESSFNNKGFVACCYNDLLKYYRLALDRNVKVVIQEMIIGPYKNGFIVCAYYSKEKELLALFSARKVRQRVDMGIAHYMISGNYPEPIDLGRKFLEGMGYTGVGFIEFKYDDRDGQFKLIELNPRLWLANIQATCAGVNFPHINYLDCIGEKVTPSLTFSENIRWLNAVPEVLSFWVDGKREDISFTEWVKSIFSVNCFAFYARDDLKPVFKRYAYAAAVLLRRYL